MNKKELLEELQEEKNALEAMQEEKEEAENKIMFLKHPIFTTKQNIEDLASELKNRDNKMRKKITYGESFVDTNLQSDDIVYNTRTDEYFTVNNINLEYAEAVLIGITSNRHRAIDLTDCEDFEIMD